MTKKLILNRRSFFKKTGITTITGIALMQAESAGIKRTSPTPKKATIYKRPLSPIDFKNSLAGPILSMPTTFTKDLDVNYQAIDTMANRALSYNVPIYALTAGNSKYRSLSYEEIKKVTQRLIEAVDGRGLTIASTGINWPVKQSVDYAHFAESIGADALQILQPHDFQQVSSGQWQNMDQGQANKLGDTDVALIESKTENKDIDKNVFIFEHFRAIAKETRLPLVFHGRYTNELLGKLSVINQLVAAKDDALLKNYITGMIEFGDRFEIFSGGQEYRYLVGYPYGAKAFYSTLTGFAPDIPMMFWKATLEGNLKKAVEITKKHDYAFIKDFSHPFWHATLEYFGVAQRYLREPYKTYTDEQMIEVKKKFDEIGINPQKYM